MKLLFSDETRDQKESTEKGQLEQLKISDRKSPSGSTALSSKIEEVTDAVQFDKDSQMFMLDVTQ
jgi:hypothetical protein